MNHSKIGVVPGRVRYIFPLSHLVRERVKERERESIDSQGAIALCTDANEVLGTKIVVMAMVEECMSFFETSSLQVARDRLQSMTSSQIPDQLSNPAGQIYLFIYVYMIYMCFLYLLTS